MTEPAKLSTIDLIAEVERLDQAATPGEWTVIENEHRHWGARRVNGPIVHVQGFTSAINFNEAQRRRVEGDSHLIASYRTLAPLLAARLKELLELVRLMTDPVKLHCDQESRMWGRIPMDLPSKYATHLNELIGRAEAALREGA